MSRLPPRPDLEWTDDAVPRARALDDVYFSRAGGLEETRAVFLAGCGLPERWQGRARFAIGELGFGVGLNALATWDLWRRTRAPGAVLHYMSVEAFPMEAADAARALAPFAEIAPLAQQLIARWPVRAYGPQRIWFDDDGFALTLLCDDALATLARTRGAVDAWFLDGFSPARNPGMWGGDLMAQVRRLCAPDARVASYSVAGDVRRALGAAGFAVEKKPGFAGKRERLEAWLHGAPQKEVAKSVAVLGAGIAGASVAAALRRRGVAVRVFDPAPGSGASGNPAALLSPRLDRTEGGVARLHRLGWLHALQSYGDAFVSTGVLRVGRDDAERAALADLLADPPLPETHMHGADGGAFFPMAGLVRPADALRAMLGEDVIAAQVAGIARRDGSWCLFDVAGAAIAEADVVVLATGAALKIFPQAAWAPLEWSRGQLEWGEGALPHALEGATYTAPFDGGVLFGATFDAMPAPAPVTADAESRARNLAALATLTGSSPPAVGQRLQSRAGVRTATPDRAPLAGPAPDAEAWARGEPGAHEGLYLLGGFGSRGFTLAPLLGESLASQICGEPDVLDAEMMDVVDPARFFRRALRRGKPLPS
jgi:tRNA 5-methylaminomethyl-2-thiouridine biosynthesis bifunctional protein